MTLEDLGTVKDPNGKRRKVYWDPISKKVYVEYAGRKDIHATASSASEAMHKAEAWLHSNL